MTNMSYVTIIRLFIACAKCLTNICFEVGWSSGIFPTVPIRQVLFTKFIELLIDKMVKET